VISDPALADEAYRTNEKFTSDRCAMQSHGGDHVPTMYAFTRNGKGIAMSTGDYWRKVRTALEKNISRQAPAQKNAPIVMKEVESVVACLKKQAEARQPLTNLTEQLKRESMNVAMTLLFEKRFGAHLPQDCKELQFAVEYCFKNLSAGNPSDMIPALRVLPNPALSEFKQVVANRDVVLDKFITASRAAFKAKRADGTIKSVDDCSSLSEQFFFNEEAGDLTADEVHMCLWDTLFAMTDTTATTNEWLIYFMVNNPDIQAKVHAEIDSVLGPDRLATLEDTKEQLPYFWAVVKETMRSQIVSPVMAPHYASEDLTIGGTGGTPEFKIPRGTQLFMNGWQMARDPTLWDHPEDFNPDRWLEGGREYGLDLYGKEKRPSSDHYKFIPFSIGKRMCPGYSFAKVSLWMQALTLMQCFEWKLSEKGKYDPRVKNGKLDMTENWGLTIIPQRYGAEGIVEAVPRPASRLCRAQEGDF